MPASRTTPLTDAVGGAALELGDAGGVCAIAAATRISDSVKRCMRSLLESGLRRRRGQVQLAGSGAVNLHFNHTLGFRKPV